MMRTVARVALVVTLVAACGSADSGVSKSAGARLHAEVTLLRAASRAGDRKGAEVELARLRAEITRLASRGELSTDAVRRLRSAIAGVERQLTRLPEPTTTTTTTLAAPEKGHGKSEEHGKHAKEQD